ncbi:MAG: FAD synthetase family protein [Lachnospiraceae bacterium]|nr:FAD synthetase family protein [Lachnospiraceae bacterium]MBO4762837.1 FAD synthetase family protein [Lachnospiraceae bacterium]MBR5367988.1 FAD synthetase family protein [Lachnospiraceae bacterium]
MEIYTYPDVNLKDTAVTIGKFDGVHHGHRYLIDILKEKAAEKKLKTVVFVVDMEDDTSGRLDIEVLKKSMKKASLLTTWDEKVKKLEQMGVDVVVRCPFTRKISMLRPMMFAKDVLARKLGCKLMVCGDDFHYGRLASGDIAKLETYGERYGYETFTVERLKEGGEVVSSTRIRELIENGKTDEAKKLMS